MLRHFGADGDDRLLLVNFGLDLNLSISPEPLQAPPMESRWGLQWSSEDPRYGGGGTAPLDTEREGWLLPGRCAVVMRPLPIEVAQVQPEFRNPA